MAEPLLGGGPDMGADVFVALYQHVQIPRLQDEQARARRRDRGRGAPGALQERDLAKEVPRADARPLAAERDLDLALDDEEHRVGALAGRREATPPITAFEPRLASGSGRL